MIPVAIDSHVPESVVRDARFMLNKFKEQGAKVRVIRIHFEDLNRIFEKLIEQHPYPFTPTFCGVPVEFGGTPEIAIIAVRDDDTNTGNNLEGKQIWQQ